MQTRACVSCSELVLTDPPFSVLGQDEALSAGFLPSQRRGWRKIEVEAERVAKRRHLMDMVAQLRESHGHAHSSGQAGSHPSPAFTLPAPSAPGDGHRSRGQSPSRSSPNGAFLEEDLPMKRRRGRRKNVEGLDLLFARHRKAAPNPVRYLTLYESSLM